MPANPSEYGRAYYLKNKERIKARQKEYYHRNKKRIQTRTSEYARRHRTENTRRAREWRQRDREKWASGESKLKQRRVSEKRVVFGHYSNGSFQCACCKEGIYEFLTLDHIRGNGTRHRRTVGSGSTFYRWLIKNGFPEGYRVLCMNCNFAEGTQGGCPHRRSK